MKASDTIEQLRSLMAMLRNPETGCPWDIKQNFRSIAPYTIEEAYEVADAISRNNARDLCEELGDLLLQIVYHSHMAEEEGLFTFNNVVQAINSKLICRHPHIFGTAAEKVIKHDEAALKQQWEKIKAQEKAAKGQKTAYYLDTVSSALPAALEAAKLQEKAEITGFDWIDPLPVLQKVQEELAELQKAIEKDCVEEQAAEYGDVLFTLVNLGRKINVDFEGSLNKTSQKFRRRFNYIEEKLKKQHKNLKEADIKTMETLWVEAKKTENHC